MQEYTNITVVYPPTVSLVVGNSKYPVQASVPPRFFIGNPNLKKIENFRGTLLAKIPRNSCNITFSPIKPPTPQLKTLF
jgi:hypothetical protein